MNRRHLAPVAGATLCCFLLAYGLPARAQEGPAPPPAYPQPAYPPPTYPPAPVYVPVPSLPVHLQPPPQQPTPPVRYKYEYRTFWELSAGGAAVLGALHFINIYAAAVGSSASTPLWPLYIPVAGPFIEAGYVDSSNLKALMVFDGIAQAACLGVVVGGLLARKRVLVYERSDTRSSKLELLPLASPTALGLAGRF